MSQHDDRVSMQQMLDFAVQASDIAGGKSKAQLEADPVVGPALRFYLIMIGEAASRVTTATRAACPNVDWINIVGLRNQVVHGYDKLDYGLLWDVIQKDLPILIGELRRLFSLHPSPIKTL